MMKKILLLIICLSTILGATQQANAQKKPKGIAKEIIGKWSLDDLLIKMDEAKATQEQKDMFNEAFSKNMREQFLKNKDKTDSGYFIFSPDGTYITRSPDTTIDQKGTWKVTKDEVSLIAENGGSDNFTGKIVDKRLHLISKNNDIPLLMTLIMKKK